MSYNYNMKGNWRMNMWEDLLNLHKDKIKIQPLFLDDWDYYNIEDDYINGEYQLNDIEENH